MWIDLGLEHLDFQIFFFFFPLDTGFNQIIDVFGHLIDLFANHSYFIIGLNGRVP